MDGEPTYKESKAPSTFSQNKARDQRYIQSDHDRQKYSISETAAAIGHTHAQDLRDKNS